ncbi:hypothetical protein AB0M47_03230 [Hamadaea sp. NPDC051192]|uniref:hypothetical protein n=1 Tax=Hamadaea sp. NPDC051192 TaxID=3154940 RepID=UPI0034312943
MYEVHGDPTAMAAFSKQLTVPPIPDSMSRASVPPNLTGLIEGIAMSLLDKAATVAAAAYLTQVTDELLTYTAKVNTIAVTYSAAEVSSAAKLVAATAKLGTAGVSMAQSLSGSTSADSADKDDKDDKDESAAKTDAAHSTDPQQQA